MSSEKHDHLDILDAADSFYTSLADRDHEALHDSLDEDFVITLSPGLPIPADRVQHGRSAAIANVWGSIPESLELECVPRRKAAISADELVVFGDYKGADWQAPFVHLLRVRNGVLFSLAQLTDSRCWPAPPEVDSPAASLARQS